MPSQETAEGLRRVLDAIDNDGIDYCFRSFSSFSEIHDDEFHRLREKYKTAANELEHYVNENAAPDPEIEEEEE